MLTIYDITQLKLNCIDKSIINANHPAAQGFLDQIHQCSSITVHPDVCFFVHAYKHYEPIGEDEDGNDIYPEITETPKFWLTSWYADMDMHWLSFDCIVETAAHNDVWNFFVDVDGQYAWNTWRRNGLLVTDGLIALVDWISNRPYSDEYRSLEFYFEDTEDK